MNEYVMKRKLNIYRFLFGKFLQRLGAMHIPHLEIALDFALEALESVNPERPIRRKKNKAR